MPAGPSGSCSCSKRYMMLAVPAETPALPGRCLPLGQARRRYRHARQRRGRDLLPGHVRDQPTGSGAGQGCGRRAGRDTPSGGRSTVATVRHRRWWRGVHALHAPPDRRACERRLVCRPSSATSASSRPGPPRSSWLTSRELSSGRAQSWSCAHGLQTEHVPVAFAVCAVQCHSTVLCRAVPQHSRGSQVSLRRCILPVWCLPLACLVPATRLASLPGRPARGSRDIFSGPNSLLPVFFCLVRVALKPMNGTCAS